MSRENIFQVSMVYFFIVLTGVIGFRLFQITVVQHEELSRLAREEVYRTLSIEPLRGKILAGDGQTLLAYSDAHVSIATDNIIIRRTRRDISIARLLSEVLSLPTEEVLSKIHSRYNATWIKRDISSDELREIFRYQKSGKLTGVHIKREIKRYYPSHPVAANIVGFVQGFRENGFDPLGPFSGIHGVEGLERTYHAELAGVPGHYAYKVNRFGSPDFGSFEQMQLPEDGDDLITTLDLQLQRIVREELLKGLIQNKAASTMAIILNPEDGAILSSVSVCNVPEEFDDFYRAYTNLNCWPVEIRKNHPTTTVFEPGSVWKPVIMSIAMEHHLVRPDESIPWYEPMVCGSKPFLDWKKFPPHLMLPEILTYSSNVGIIQVSKRIFNTLEPNEIADEFRRLGFARRLPIDFPTRPRGLLSPASWCAISVGAVAEGYELGITMIQLASFYCAIANGGYRVDPHFGAELRDPATGRIIKELRPATVERILSPETCRFIRSALTDCVDHGTGKNASLKDLGCIVAGKTATAKLSIAGNYNTGKYRASFAGMFPAHDPKLVVVISVEDPKAGSYYGGAVAAPLFKQIGERIFQLNPELYASPPPQPPPDPLPGQETTV